MGNVINWITKNVPSGDSRAGSASGGTAPQSAFAMVETLGPVLLVALVLFTIFLFLRRTQKRYYAPRSYLGSFREFERTPSMPNGLFNWMGPFWRLPDAYALKHQSLDAYLFIRYLRVCFFICFVSLCITWPILFPITATGGGGMSQLELLSYSNLNIDKYPNRAYAHVFVSWAVFGFIMYMIMRELIFYINLRNAFLLTPQYANRISSRTVLFTSVPEEYRDEARIREMFNNSVKNVWIAGVTDELDEMVKDRDDVAMRLEKAEVKLIKMVNKERVKANKKSGNSERSADADMTRDAESGNIDGRWIDAKKRPSHKLGKMGLIGKKVDTIEWGRSELQESIPKVEAAQAEWLAGNYKKIGAVFVEFHTQADAQAALQVVTHHQALHMCPKSIGLKPSEIVWSSLAYPWWQVVLRRYAVNAVIGLFVIFFAIPVAIIGIISNVDTLKSIPGLTWIGDIPKPILGFISGLLPSVLLALLMSLVPVIMRVLAKKAGCVSLTQVELYTQNAYFFFQVLQVFLIRTLVGGAVPSIIKIASNPGDVFSILSSVLPTTSNFYISYFIVQGITIAAGVLTQVAGLAVLKILYKYLAGTPRAKYIKWTTLSAVLWGSVLPVYSCIVVISITYTVIAPVILFWSSLALGLFYLAYRYNILFMSETKIDTRGLIYPRALKQLFVGIYLAEICQIGLFAVSKLAGPAVLMVVFLIFTVLFNITIRNVFTPLIHGLPRSLESHEENIRQGRVANSDKEDGVVSNEVSHEAAHDASPEAANGASNDTNGKAVNEKAAATGKGGVQKKGNFVAQFFMPWKFANYDTLRKLVPHEETIEIPQMYTDEVESTAYVPISVGAPTPLLWIPQDAAGVSKQEVMHTSKVVPITDEGCTLTDKGDLEWDRENARPPIYMEKVYY